MSDKKIDKIAGKRELKGVCMYGITQDEKNSILYYQGAVNKIKLNQESSHLKSFYSVSNAYETMNTLLFPGIENEQTRIIQEKRLLDIEMLNYMPEILKVYGNIYSAMCKYTYHENCDERLYTWRKDRINSLSFFENGYNCCFLSSSLEDKVNPYFFKKSGLLLLEIDAPGKIEHLDMNKVLGEDSKYPDEDEILFPPFLYFQKRELELTEVEKGYKDCNSQPPKGKYEIKIYGSMISVEDYKNSVQENEMLYRLYEEIINTDSIDNAKKVFNTLSLGNIPQDDVIRKYDEWKKRIHSYLLLKFSKIKVTTINEYAMKNRIELFQDELTKYISETDRKRKKYKKELERVNFVLSLLNPLYYGCLALSFIPGFDTWLRIFSFLFLTISIIITGICKSFALDGKWKQRTITYLRLDELSRDFRYETDYTNEVIDKYIERFKSIIKDDDSMCEENTQSIISHLQTQYKSELEEKK